jgi:tRNA threonylcarbamoyladenosine biosynthesis protein TsaB
VDARKEEVYTALYRYGRGEGVERLTPFQALSLTALMEGIPPQETVFTGDGVEVYGEIIKEHLGAQALFAPPLLRFQRGTIVAQLGLRRIMKGEHDNITTLVPIYVRQSDAEITWEKGKGG